MSFFFPDHSFISFLPFSFVTIQMSNNTLLNTNLVINSTFGNHDSYSHLLLCQYCHACHREHPSAELTHLRNLFNATIALQFHTPLSNVEAHINFATTLTTLLLRMKGILDGPHCISVVQIVQQHH